MRSAVFAVSFFLMVRSFMVFLIWSSERIYRKACICFLCGEGIEQVKKEPY